MSKNEGAGFRKSLFGGFKNKDVIDYIANSARSWKNEKETLERSLADSEKRAASAGFSLEREKKENEALREDCERMRALINDHEERIATVTAEASSVAEENGRMAREIERLSRELSEARAELGGLTAAYSETAAALAIKEEELSRIEGENTVLKAAAALYSSKETALEEELASLRRKNEALEAENLCLSSRSDSLKTFADGIATMLAGLNGNKPE